MHRVVHALNIDTGAKKIVHDIMISADVRQGGVVSGMFADGLPWIERQSC